MSETLIKAAISPDTRKVYIRSWDKLKTFCEKYNLVMSFPIHSATLLRFVSFLFHQGYAYASISVMLSAISYIHKARKLDDPCDIQVKNALLGAKNLSPPQKGSLPVHIETLEDISNLADGVLPNSFTLLLFRAMTILAYFALLRVGEFTFSKHTLRYEDIVLTQDTITINFQSFKHSKGKPFVHTIHARKPSAICPVQALSSYLQVRPSGHEFLFVKENGRTPSRKEFWDWMREVLQQCGINVELYSPHSLRIGMATHMALSGASTEQIKIAGRWSSDAFRKYIHVTKF